MQVNVHRIVGVKVFDFSRLGSGGDFLTVRLLGDGGEVVLFVQVDEAGKVSEMLDVVRQQLNAVARRGN